MHDLAPKKINENVVAPVFYLGNLSEGLEELPRETGTCIVNFGHAGNGKIYGKLMVHPDDPAEIGTVRPCLSAVFDLVPTLSGGHGVGLEKGGFLGRKLYSNGILYRGKGFPD